MNIKRLNALFGSIIMLFSSYLAYAALPMAVEDEPLPSLAPMLENVTPAVVNIATEGRVQLKQNPLFNDPFFRRFFNIPEQQRPQERKTQSLGSGVIVDAERGLVLTNSHVIANAVEITVTMRDGRQLKAEVLGTDPETDVAVIKIPTENLTALKPTDSDALRVGDFVVAIGNPFGLGQTVTSGIVSALSRSGLGIEGYEDFIQTDASINPGNSGGALVNLKGELVGINTAIFSQSGGNIGIGFAIPINLALQITEQLLDKGEVNRGFIGIQAQDLNPDLAEAFGIKDKRGAIINSVMPDSPADDAGLKPGDVITSVNKKQVKKAADVRLHIGLLPVGEKVVFEILREGKRKKLTAYIAPRAEVAKNPAAINPRLKGVSIGDIDEDSPYFGRLEGVVVVDIERASHAWNSGMRQGDIITSVNRKPVKNLSSFLKAVDGEKNSLLLRIVRGRSAAFLVIK
ncbi:MAG: Do family serine endopeptidase [Gammaproteobacteria bacterium]|nr:Do family serine endopeptidase [Gammaproteobacteria bacterium]